MERPGAVQRKVLKKAGADGPALKLELNQKHVRNTAEINKKLVFKCLKAYKSICQHLRVIDAMGNCRSEIATSFSVALVDMNGNESLYVEQYSPDLDKYFSCMAHENENHLYSCFLISSH
ncbi:hypothetical protein llap_7891 [Limosa lapponica baueri]|uniref:Uncharacterized protein n=1 Tax=Limosa lapponica baueri TaxID=1758121 RepID=A0A2I0U6W9_LIMLA|nr:hypothetical protein llap_7891 [Limosa lapponica baueri]